MSQSNIDVVRGGYEAFARQDIPGVLERFAADIEWHSPESLPTGGTYRGPEGVGGFFATLPDHYEELDVQPREYLDAGDTVVVLGRITGRGAGGPFKADWVHIWDVHDGKVARFREVADTAPIARALEAAAV